MLSIGRLILSSRNNYKITIGNKQVSGKKCNILSEKSDDIIVKTSKEFNPVDEYVILENNIIKNSIGKVGNKQDDLNIFYNLYTVNWLSNKNYKKLWEEDKKDNKDNKDYDISKTRKDYTKPVITIDPINSIDLDDGFTLWEDENNYYLDIHIADPVSYFNFELDKTKEIFNELYKRVATCYIPHENPTHLLPDFIVNKVTLIQSNVFKRAITFKYIISKSEDKYDFEYEMTKLYKIYNTDYDSYDKKLNSNSSHKGMIILLVKKMVLLMNLKYDINKFAIDKDISHNMIEIFMIWVNYTTGNYLYKENVYGIFRTQEKTEEETNNIIIPEYAKAFLSHSANYEIFSKDNKVNNELNELNKIYLHHTLGINNYAHVSSPMRRVIDMINHMILHKIKPEIIDLLNIEKINETLKIQKRISNAYDLLKYLSITQKFKGYILDINEYEKKNYLLLVVYDEINDFKKIINVESPINDKIIKYTEIDIEIYYNAYNFHSNKFPFSIKIL
jgi:exoribonuclease R